MRPVVNQVVKGLWLAAKLRARHVPTRAQPALHQARSRCSLVMAARVAASPSEGRFEVLASAALAPL
jgi:hypothetical protein